MTLPDLTKLRLVTPGAENRLPLGPATYVIGRAAWTDGAYTVFDQVVAPRIVTPPHSHAEETQVAIVLSGTVGFWVDGEETLAGPGDYVLRPAGLPHALWNPTDEPARIIEMTSPATRFEAYMERLAELVARSADPAEVEALAGDYGVTFHPEFLADLCERHGVDPRGMFWK